MDQEPIREVTIVGGGTAGWLTATILNQKLNTPGQAPRVRVVLIESPTVPTVGVGEGTLPSMPSLLQQIGVDEHDFLRECNGSFKFGVRFEGWNLDERGIPYSFLHAFTGYPAQIAGIPSLHYFLTHGAHPGRHQYDVSDSLCALTEVVRHHRAPRTIKMQGYARTPFTRYSYHLDAARFAVFLRDFSIARGVIHISDDVDEAIIGENNHVTQLRLRQNGLRPVELVIDCTGFQGLLLTKLLGEPFQSYGQHLLCDRAIPIQIPHPEGQPLAVHTAATAMSAGWIWKVPLYSRIGTGYVYSSAHRTDDEALREICNHLHLDPEKVDTRVIRMRIGRLRRSWVGNCIAIGLSGGFIEPLEATAIATIDFAARSLVDNFPTRTMAPALADRYNRQMNLLYDAVRDFITLHYYLANRTEPFWIAARSPTVPSDTLRQNLELWRHRMPTNNDLQPLMLFTAMSYAICMTSKGFFRDQKLPIQLPPPRPVWAGMARRFERDRMRLRGLPAARYLLAHIRGEAAAAAPQAPA